MQGEHWDSEKTNSTSQLDGTERGWRIRTWILSWTCMRCFCKSCACEFKYEPRSYKLIRRYFINQYNFDTEINALKCVSNRLIPELYSFKRKLTSQNLQSMLLLLIILELWYVSSKPVWLEPVHWYQDLICDRNLEKRKRFVIYV